MTDRVCKRRVSTWGRVSLSIKESFQEYSQLIEGIHFKRNKLPYRGVL